MTTQIKDAAATFWLEAESFKSKGGWVVDQQFMEQMGSPYLLAHGLGQPVKDATTTFDASESETVFVWARTYNWTSPWSKKPGPGKFQIIINGATLPNILGNTGTAWEWQLAGSATLLKGTNHIALHDLTGFDGRCDAIALTRDKTPPAKRPEPKPGRPAGDFDIVVCGGGIAGICAALAAARLGSKVALVNDRPVLGGCNSSEIRVHLGGRIETGPYVNLGNLIKEFGPLRGGNAQPGDFYEDQKKLDIVANEPNITSFPNFRVVQANMKDRTIESIVAQHIESGTRFVFNAKIFIDCTGDATLGALAKADFRMGREAKHEFNEPEAPDKADDQTMGASVQWYSVQSDKPEPFPEFDYFDLINEKTCEKVTMGEWTWETGMFQDQIDDFERIRDYGMLVVYSNWSILKNRLPDNQAYANRKLGWVAYIAGKRESRRLLGDHILTQNDLVNRVPYDDPTAATTWTIDLHYPDPKNTANFPGCEFKSIAVHQAIHPYPVPYRCLYSRNTANLMMAGRNISVTHIALGTIRVMRTTGMLGEVAGIAANLCIKHNANPRDIYNDHLDELKAIMEIGTGKQNLPNNQTYNMGTCLKP